MMSETKLFYDRTTGHYFRLDDETVHELIAEAYDASIDRDYITLNECMRMLNVKGPSKWRKSEKSYKKRRHYVSSYTNQEVKFTEVWKLTEDGLAVTLLEFKLEDEEL